MSETKVHYITPPNNLKMKQKLAGVTGTLDPIWLEKAEASIASVKNEYLDAVHDDLDQLQAAYEAALKDPAGRSEKVKDFYALVQTIKGQGGSFGYPLMTNIGNQLCRFIEETAFAKEGGTLTDAQMDVVKVHVEALRLVIQQHMEGEGGPVGQKLMLGLGLVVKKAMS